MRIYQGMVLGSICLAFYSCGELIPNKTENSSNRFTATLNYISENGLPRLDQLFPRLPRHLAVIEGVDLASDGLPSRPTDTSFAKAEITNLNQVETLAQDASLVTMQGFSEVRRLESVIFNFLQPVYEVMGRDDLFSKLKAPAQQDELPNLDDLLNQRNFTQNTASDLSSIFSSLFTKLSYTVELGQSDILPEFLKISATPASEMITISGLFASSAEDLTTGFALGMRINSLDSFALDFTFNPASLAGMIGSWKNNQCADDLFRIRLINEGGTRSATVSSLECPDTLAALSQLTISLSSDAMGISGVFSQEYAGVQEHSLRGFLGQKQGFVLQAAASTDLQRLSAAAAVLGESDLQNVSKESISEFGIGDLFGKYINAKFWKPKLSAQQNYNGLSLSHYQNPAFLLCNDFVAATLNVTLNNGINEINKLCAGEDISGDSYLAGFSRLSANIKSSSTTIANTLNAITFGLISKSDVQATTLTTTKLLDKIVEVLNFRNNIFVGSAGDLAFKEAPSTDYDPLVSALEAGAELSAGDLNWVDETRSQLPNIRRADLPAFEFSSSLDGLRDFFTDSCSSFSQTVISESGGKANLSSNC